MGHDDVQATYFDGLAVERGLNEGANTDKFATIEALLPDAKSAPRLAECGGGAGFYTRRFLERGHHVTNVDLSKDALRNCEKLAAQLDARDRLNTVHGDFVSFANDTEQQFDVLTFIKVLHHFDSVEAIEEALVAAARCATPDGKIVIFEPNGFNPLWRPFYLLQRAPGTRHTKWHFEKNIRLTTPATFTRILDAHGARYAMDFHYVVPAQILGRSLPRTGTTLTRLNRALERQPRVARYAANLSLVIDASSLNR